MWVGVGVGGVGSGGVDFGDVDFVGGGVVVVNALAASPWADGSSYSGKGLPALISASQRS